MVIGAVPGLTVLQLPENMRTGSVRAREYEELACGFPDCDQYVLMNGGIEFKRFVYEDKGDVTSLGQMQKLQNIFRRKICCERVQCGRWPKDRFSPL